MVCWDPTKAPRVRQNVSKDPENARPSAELCRAQADLAFLESLWKLGARQQSYHIVPRCSQLNQLQSSPELPSRRFYAPARISCPWQPLQAHRLSHVFLDSFIMARTGSAAPFGYACLQPWRVPTLNFQKAELLPAGLDPGGTTDTQNQHLGTGTCTPMFLFGDDGKRSITKCKAAARSTARRNYHQRRALFPRRPNFTKRSNYTKSTTFSFVVMLYFAQIRCRHCAFLWAPRSAETDSEFRLAMVTKQPCLQATLQI